MAKYNLHMKRAFLHYGRLCASLRFLSAWTFYHRIHKSGSWKWLFSSVEDYVLLKDSSWHELTFTGFTNSGPENGFSPVWKTMWFFNIALYMNFLSHDSQIRVLKLAFLQYGKLYASLRLHLTWTFCHMIYKSGSWNWLFSSMENYVPL